MEKCRLTVHVSTKLNRSHLVTGDEAIILPCLGRTEIDTQASGKQFVTVEDSMSMVHASHGHLPPGSPLLKSEVAIIAGLAKAVFKNQPAKASLVKWDDLIDNYDLIREHISHVVHGFENFNEKVNYPGGFHLYHPVRDLVFNTKTDKVNFAVHPIVRHDLLKNQFMLMTIRSHDQFNTTIYGLNDRYRGVTGGRRVIFMNSDDMAASNLQDGAFVDITSHFDQEKRVVLHFMVVHYDIPRQCVAAYYPETNVLVPIGSVAERSNTPAYKSIRVSVAPSITAT